MMQGGQIRKVAHYQYNKNDLLGKGRFGNVYKGRNLQTQKEVSLKFVKKNFQSDDYEKAALFSQLKVRASIKSNNLVQVSDIFQLEHSYCIVRQQCHGDLRSVIKKKGIAEESAKQILRQIASGCLTLVKAGVIHGCLRPSAILFKKNSDITTYKIGDHIVERKIFVNKVEEMATESKKYLAVQTLKGEKENQKCDIWSIGCIYYELLHGEKVIDIQNEYQIIQAIDKKQFRPFKDSISNVSKDFLMKCLKPIQGQRIGWDEFFSHQIFDGFFIKHKPCHFNTTKRIMGDLRFKINMQNLSIFKILFEMGYKNEENQLQLKNFSYFMKNLDQNISKEEIMHVFEEISSNKKTISIGQITTLMERNQIYLQSVFENIPRFSKKYKISAKKLEKIIQESQMKIKHIFINLHKMIRQKKGSLHNIFKQYATTMKGRLLKNQFRRLLMNIDKTIQEDEINGIFDLIDEDRSKTILFDELNKHYSRINGLPEHMNHCKEMEEIQAIQSDFEEEDYILKDLIFPKMYGYSGFKPNVSFSAWTEQQE